MSQDNIFEDHDEIINEEWQDLEAGETTAFIGMVIRPTHNMVEGFTRPLAMFLP